MDIRTDFRLGCRNGISLSVNLLIVCILFLTTMLVINLYPEYFSRKSVLHKYFAGVHNQEYECTS